MDSRFRGNDSSGCEVYPKQTQGGEAAHLPDTFAPLSMTLRCQIAATLYGVRTRFRKDSEEKGY